MTQGPEVTQEMTRSIFTILLLLLVLPALYGCGSPHDQPIKVTDNYDLGRQNIVHVSERQRSALVSLFDSGVPIKAVRWPSNAVIGFYANQDLWKGVAAPLPSHMARRFNKDEDMMRSAWNVYRISVVRGLDKPLIQRYFNSRMGRRELRGTYLINLALSCYKDYEKIPDSIKDDAKQVYDVGGPINFKCPKKPSIHARKIP